MSTTYPYISDSQIAKYISQFMRAMSGFQVRESGDSNKLIKVPVRYGSMNRIVASVLQRRDSFTNTALPLMAVNLTGISKDDDRKVSHHHMDSTLIEVDQQSLAANRLVGPALTLEFELSIYTSSTTQLFEVSEQLMLLFNPRITIQVDNSTLNSDYITEITMDSIANEIQYPLGTEAQTVMQTFSFSVPIRLRYPFTITDTLIKEIRNKIFDDTTENVVELTELVIN